MHPTRVLCATAIAAAMTAGAAQAGTLVINTATSDPAPRAAFQELIDRFVAENPDVEIELNVFEHEAYKTAIRNWLGAEPPDVVTWFAGERMNAFVQRGLFEDVSEIWEENGLAEAMPSSVGSMTIDGAQYGVPYTYYQWGIYYRKDIFEEHGIEPFETLDDMVAACETLSAAGIAPITIGTRFLWTTAGWFDYLNLRTNGLDFHLALAAGEESYEDERVREVFAHWQRLLDAGCFIDNHTAYSWQEAIPFMRRGEASMYLIGNFIVPFLEEIDRYGFMQFPVINPDVAMYEDAPIDTLHIPTGANNPEDARRFLAFVAQADQQYAMNQTLEQLPPHREAGVADAPFLAEGYEMLNAAAGIAQFYDRDTDPEMARAGMEGFQEFMVNPDRLDRILSQLDRTRQRIFSD